MRVTTVLLGCAACLLLSQPGVARVINKVTVAVSKPGMTIGEVESDRRSCVPTSTEVHYATRTFIRCMEHKGYRVDPEGYRLTLLIREPRLGAHPSNGLSGGVPGVAGGQPAFMTALSEQSPIATGRR